MSFIEKLPNMLALLLLVGPSAAIYNSASRSNVAVYWGQGPNQLSLSHYCQQSTIDIVTIAFMNVFPAQGNGFPGDNFGNQCWGGTYPGPGNNPSENELQSQCPQMVADIPVCQNTYGKKIILSLGGSTNTYQLTGASNGVAFADFLWGAFGPQNASWIAQGLPRPFDGSNGQAVMVDGFDFDIEYQSTDNSAGYIAMIKRLRSHFSGASKQYFITGAPQCVVPDANMGTMIANAQFDIIWVQFYNDAQCSAKDWSNANPNYNSTHSEVASSFSFNAWANFLVGTASANAKLWIGLSGSASATEDPSFLLTPAQVSDLAAAYYCKPSFGGIMIWEATYAESNVNSGYTYYQSVKNILVADSQNPSFTCNVCSVTSSTSKPSKSTSSTTLTHTSTTLGTKTLTRYSSSSGVKSFSTSTSVKSSPKTTITPVSSSSSKSSSNSLSPRGSLKTSPTTSKSSTSTKASYTNTTKSTTRVSASTRASPSSKPVSPVSSCTKKTTTTTTASKPVSPVSSCTKKTTTTNNSINTPRSSVKTSAANPTTFKVVSSSLKAATGTTSAAQSAKTYPPVPAGGCGPEYMVSCAAGYCCSAYGWCGTGAPWCGTGCQPGFGMCS